MLKIGLRDGMPLNIVSVYRNAIYGFAILWVVLFHAHAIDKVRVIINEPGFYWLGRFIATGNVGVDIFLFLSGVSLYFSFSRNSNIKRFYKKRVMRIVPSVWVIFGVYWFVRYFVLKFSPIDFFSRMTIMRFWVTGDSSIWFVSLVVLLYLLYPLIYKWLYGWESGMPARAAFAIVCSVLVAVAVSHVAPGYYEKVEIALTRVPVFLFGCAMGRAIMEKRKVSWAWIILIIGGVVLYYMGIEMKFASGMGRRYLSGIAGVSLAYLLALFLHACVSATKNEDLGMVKFFSWLGGFSLELYLSHIMLNQVLRLCPFYVEGDAIQYAAMATLAVFLAWLTKRVLDILFGKLAMRSKKRIAST